MYAVQYGTSGYDTDIEAYLAISLIGSTLFIVTTQDLLGRSCLKVDVGTSLLLHGDPGGIQAGQRS